MKSQDCSVFLVKAGICVTCSGAQHQTQERPTQLSFTATWRANISVHSQLFSAASIQLCSQAESANTHEQFARRFAAILGISVCDLIESATRRMTLSYQQRTVVSLCV